jgi:hypothetical protein
MRCQRSRDTVGCVCVYSTYDLRPGLLMGVFLLAYAISKTYIFDQISMIYGMYVFGLLNGSVGSWRKGFYMARADLDRHYLVIPKASLNFTTSDSLANCSFVS